MLVVQVQKIVWRERWYTVSHAYNCTESERLRERERMWRWWSTQHRGFKTIYNKCLINVFEAPIENFNIFPIFNRLLGAQQTEWSEGAIYFFCLLLKMWRTRETNAQNGIQRLSIVTKQIICLFMGWFCVCGKFASFFTF